MKNLENFGVQELTTVEKRELQGGLWPVVWVIVGALLTQDLGDLKDAFNAGYNDVRN